MSQRLFKSEAHIPVVKATEINRLIKLDSYCNSKNADTFSKKYPEIGIESFCTCSIIQ